MSDDYGFLETKTDDNGDPITAGGITLATGIKWTKVATTLVGSLIASWFLGLQAVIEGGFSFFTNGGILDALSSFASDVLLAVLSGPVELLTTAAEESASWVNSTFTGPLSLLAFPAGVAILMAGLWIAARGLEEVT